LEGSVKRARGLRMVSVQTNLGVLEVDLAARPDDAIRRDRLTLAISSGKSVC